MLLLAGAIALGVVCSEPSLPDVVPDIGLPPGVMWHAPAEPGLDASDSFAAVFVREHVGPDNWDFIASAWDVRLEPEASIAPRIRFVPSHWAPNVLDRFLAKSRLDLVRLQIPSGDGAGYRVNLYSIDYRDWTVSTVLMEEQVLAVFEHDREVYFSTAARRPEPDGLRILDANNSVRTPKEPFEYVRYIPGHPTLHLVVRDEAHALFDAETESFVSLPSLPIEMDQGEATSIALSPDQQWIAVHTCFEGAEQLSSFMPGATEVVNTRVHLINRETGDATAIPISGQLAYGSGVPFIGLDVLVGFDPAGRLILAGSEIGDDSRVTQKVIAVTPGIDAHETLDAVPEDVLRRSPWDRASPPVSEAVAAVLGDGHHDDLDVAIALLKTHGIALDAQQPYVHCRYGYSADGTRFLLKTTETGFRGWFYYGDLASGEVRRIPCPEALVWMNAMNIVVLE